MRECCKHQCIKYCPLQQKWTIAKSFCQAMWSTFYYSNCVRGADLLAFQQEFRADFKSHAGVKRMKRSAGVVLQKQPAARSAFVNIIIIWKRCQMLAFMPTETSSWEKRSLKVAITPAAFKPSILDQKNHFSFFLSSPSRKAQLFPCYNKMVSPLHLLEDVQPTQYPQFSPHTQPVLQLPSKPILEIPSQTPSRNFPIQYLGPTIS